MDKNGLLNGQWTFRPFWQICILLLAHGSVRAQANERMSQPGRLRHFLNRVQVHPSKQPLYKNFVLLLPNFFFFVKDFSEKQSSSHWHTDFKTTPIPFFFFSD